MLSEVSVADEPFYKRWWFLIIIALAGIIIILIVIGLLYITGRKHRRRSAKSLSRSLVCSFPNHSCISFVEASESCWSFLFCGWMA